MAKCSCPRECGFHRTGQYAHRVQMARVRSALNNDAEGIAKYLEQCQKMVDSGQWAKQGITVAEGGRIYHL